MAKNDFFIKMSFTGSDVHRITLGCVSNQGARSYQ